MPIAPPTPPPLTWTPVRIIAALTEGRLELVPSASEPTFCQAQLLPESQLWDATGVPLDPATLQTGDAVQLGGTLTAQRVLLVTWLCRGHPLPVAAS